MAGYRQYTETDQLLNATDNRDQKSHEQKERCSTDRCGKRCILLMASIPSILLIITITAYYHEIQKPKRLMLRYKWEADDALVLLNGLSDSENNTVGCESTVLISRHCEDLGGHVRYEDGTSHCSYLGFQRSLYLATLFGNSSSNANVRWPMPSKLYGMWNRDGTNKRQYEMLRPLSRNSGVPIEMFPFYSAAVDLRDKLFGLLSSGHFCNQVVVIVWKHAYIPPLAAALGCDQERGCPDSFDDYDFDTVWELQYVYKPEQLEAFSDEGSVFQHHDKSLVQGWKVFGSVTKQYFDALRFKRGKTNWMKHSEHG
mmetsp:Transcript_14577/g.21493  ORF Transcript_14577/g.21493 Transcript_14577/m.21493 type:complete len:313 (+) Transcript_14577:54-992(+)